MFRPRLILLIGPAAPEVASVLRPKPGEHTLVACPCGCDVGVLPGDSCALVGWEVRDYWEAPRNIWGLLRGALLAHNERAKVADFFPTDALLVQQAEEAIRSLEGGVGLLVDLVLTEGTDYCRDHHNPLTGRQDAWKWDCGRCNFRLDLPDRLTILAPEAPPLLVHRVNMWGGEIWGCSPTSDCEYPPCTIWYPGGKWMHYSWREAAVSVLGRDI